MIRVTIEMVPGGIGKPRKMHVIEIWNTMRTTALTGGRQGDYEYRVSRKINSRGTVTWHKKGGIVGFRRLQRNAVHLLLECLRDAYPKAGEDG